jgi:hypothetical protein
MGPDSGSRRLVFQDGFWNIGAFPTGIKRPGCEADHSSPISAEVKMYTSTPLPINPHNNAFFVKQRDKFTLPFNGIITFCYKNYESLLKDYQQISKAGKSIILLVIRV